MGGLTADDAFKWEPGFPAELSVDSGNEEQADRENLKLGTMSKTLIAQKKGHHRREIERQRAGEVEDLIVAAKGVHERHPEVSFELAMQLLEQRQPNLTGPPVRQAPGAPPHGAGAGPGGN